MLWWLYGCFWKIYKCCDGSAGDVAALQMQTPFESLHYFGDTQCLRGSVISVVMQRGHLWLLNCLLLLYVYHVGSMDDFEDYTCFGGSPGALGDSTDAMMPHQVTVSM